MVTLRPSLKPPSSSPRSKAARRGAKPSGVPSARNPTSGIARCCACAASGHRTAAPPSPKTNCRLLIQIVIRPSPEGITLRIEYHALKWRSVALKIKVDMRGGFREYSATNAVRRCGQTITVCLVAATIQTGLDIVDPHKEQNLN